jgi:TolB protein
MTQMKFFTAIFACGAAMSLTAQTPQQPPAGQQPQDPSEVRTVLIGDPGRPPRLAIPEFIPLSKEPDVVAAAKTIGDVLWDDFAFEKEFYLIPRDVLRTVPRPASPDQIALDRWKELGADGLIVGAVQKGPEGIIVEMRFMRVIDGTMVIGKKYSGSTRSVADGGRVFAHSIADEVHKMRNLRGVAKTKLAFSSDRDGARMKGPVGDRDISNIYQSDYDGANQSRLTVNRSIDIAPTWSPDGTVIAYTSYKTGYPDIILQSLRDARMPQMPAKGSPEVQNYLPAWSPDGTRLAFMSTRDGGGNSEIYVVNRDGTGLRRITNHPGADSTPTWSPTGQQIAFTSDRSGAPQVYIVNIDGTGIQRIDCDSSWCDRATWSPAPLNEIAYASRSGAGFDIRIFDFQSRSSRTITDGIGSNESPSFAPNGRHLAFASDRSGRHQIYTIARDGTGLRQITKAGTNRFPSWSQ